jgi:hypothetical protein
LRDGKPIAIPFVIDGLLTQGGFSALAAKPKQGKSSLSRYEAVAVSKGTQFLGRNTEQGEVILVSLEDPRNHVDNCLSVLGHDPKNDATIHIVEKLPPRIEETIEVLGEALSKMPGVRLVIVDTLAKVLRVSDLNDYMPTLIAVEQLRNLARKFPKLHIQGLAHCKKIKTDDPFDSLLGSTALRGEPDTSIVIYDQNRQRIIETETRIGRNIPATILKAELTESAGADVVRDFSLHMPFEQWKTEQSEKKDVGKALSYEDRIIEHLSQCVNLTAPQESVLKSVEGKRERLLDAIENLESNEVVTITGVRRSPTNPITLRLKPESLAMNDLRNRFGRLN